MGLQRLSQCCVVDYLSLTVLASIFFNSASGSSIAIRYWFNIVVRGDSNHHSVTVSLSRLWPRSEQYSSTSASWSFSSNACAPPSSHVPVPLG